MKEHLEAQAILEGLFDTPPRSDAELRARLASIEPAQGRRWLLARLKLQGAPPRDSATLVGALGVLGLGEGDRPALSALLLDPSAVISGRAVALALLSALDGARAQELASRLSGDDLMALNDAQLTSVIATMPTTPTRVAEVTQKLARQAAASRPLRFAQIERIRRRLAIPAALLYRDAIGREEIGLDSALIDRVVAEGGEAAAILFEQRWRTTADPAAQGRFATALARLHQAGARPEVEVPRAEAFASRSEDGAIHVVVSLESAVDGSFTVAMARLAAGKAGGADGPMLAGRVVSLASPRERDEIVASVGARDPATLAEVGARVEAAAQRTRDAAALATPDGFAALCFFSLARRLAV